MYTLHDLITYALYFYCRIGATKHKKRHRNSARMLKLKYLKNIDDEQCSNTNKVDAT